MKVSKINTSSFAISRDAEHRVREMAAVDSKYGINVTLTGRYAPLAKFKVTRREKVISGAINFLALKKTVYSENSNFFYVNLANARLVYVSGKSRHGIELADVEFFERLLGLPSKTISAFGFLLENGSTKKDEIDEDILDELLAHGLAEEYLYERNILLDYAIREVVDFVGKPPEGRRELVKPTYILPSFGSAKYNISNFLEVDDTIEASYEKDIVKYGEEQVSGVLGTLFRGKVDVVEIAYLPYFQYRTIEVGTGRQETHLLPCLKGKTKFAYTRPFKLRPISIYSMGVGARVIPIEGEVITFDDIADLKQAKDEIRRRIITPLKTGFSGQSGYELSGGILFYGPPGCGKTYLAKATVGEVGISFISANIENIMGEGVDMAAGKLHDIFEYARSAAPCVLFFDEIDTIASRRDLHQSASIVNQLLTEMDGITGLGKDIIIIGATNMPWRIDPALLRGGRFTEQIYLKPPDFESRVEIFEIHLK
ncbi:MAG: ATP-binding protein, partial [Candidatus Altiarchaeales archaeon]|nr:ATP-binding protein [Candidatus Altiarchaeales archaeon]